MIRYSTSTQQVSNTCHTSAVSIENTSITEIHRSESMWETLFLVKQLHKGFLHLHQYLMSSILRMILFLFEIVKNGKKKAKAKHCVYKDRIGHSLSLPYFPSSVFLLQVVEIIVKGRWKWIKHLTWMNIRNVNSMTLWKLSFQNPVAEYITAFLSTLWWCCWIMSVIN